MPARERIATSSRSLRRGRSGLALDLLVLAIWRDIDNETYAKVAGIASVWTFFALIALGLTLAVDARRTALADPVPRAVAVDHLSPGLISTYLIVTAGGDNPSDEFTVGGARGLTVRSRATTTLLRVLGVVVSSLVACFWFAARSRRSHRTRAAATGSRTQTLKRMLRTSPSSTT